MTVSNSVIVFGGNHHNTLGVIRSLGQKGLSTILLLVDDDDRVSYVSKSKYIAKVHKYASYESGVQYLEDLAPSLKEKKLLFAAPMVRQVQWICITTFWHIRSIYLIVLNRERFRD